ncbi:MAG: TIGR02253 family HAD-type hydrolase [Planctomycetes bacterium]|nr:TIGR02253 family HAD-type hydrolase [Planctomycetota bacterium]
MSELRAILFDIDDTLCDTTGFARQARRNAVKAMVAAGLKADPEVVFAELEEVIAEFSSNYEHHFDKLLLRLPRESLTNLNRSLVVAAGVAAYHDTKFHELRTFPGVKELFHDLKAAGLRLGVITHGLSVKQAEKLVRLGLVPYLDREAVFISDEIGISKPNPKLYQLALRTLALQPRQVMYVGDNPKNDIAPPKKLGMVTVWAARAARSQPTPAETPDHAIRDFDELRALLIAHYGVAIAPKAAAAS